MLKIYDKDSFSHSYESARANILVELNFDGRETIQEWYSWCHEVPITIHLNQFTRSNIVDFLFDKDRRGLRDIVMLDSMSDFMLFKLRWHNVDNVQFELLGDFSE